MQKYRPKEIVMSILIILGILAAFALLVGLSVWVVISFSIFLEMIGVHMSPY